MPHLVRAHGVTGTGRTRCPGTPASSRLPGSRVTLDGRVTAGSLRKFKALGANHAVVLRTLRPGAELAMGNDSGPGGTSIRAAVRGRLGREILPGADVTMPDTDSDPLAARARRRCRRDPEAIAAAPVVIEGNRFVGTGSRVLQGGAIGRDSVIGAGSEIARSIAPRSIAAANPARVIRAL